MVGNVFDDGEIVRAGNHGLDSSAQAHKKIHGLACTARIECRRRLIQQQNLGIENEYGRQRHALLLPRREMMRRAIPQMRDLHHFQDLLHLGANILPRPFHLQRPKGNFVKHGRREELDVRVLKDKSHAAAEGVSKLRILKTFLGESFTAESDAALFGKSEAIQHSQQR